MFVKKTESKENMLRKLMKLKLKTIKQSSLNLDRVKRNVVEEGKLKNQQVNILVYSFTLVFTLILVGYAVMVTYKNWEDTTNKLVDCNH